MRREVPAKRDMVCGCRDLASVIGAFDLAAVVFYLLGVNDLGCIAKAFQGRDRVCIGRCIYFILEVSNL
jgi:hypothetical protein